MEETTTSIETIENNLLNSVISDNLEQLSCDYAEIFLDALLEDGVANDIPIFGTLIKLRKLGLGIREEFLAKKIYSFLFEIKDISQNKRENFIQELNNQEFGQRAGETLIMLLERFDNLSKPKILANLLKAKVSNEIDIDSFIRLAGIVDRAFFNDLKHLNKYKKKHDYNNSFELEALISLGLVYHAVSSPTADVNIFLLTSLGEILLKYGIKN